MLDVLGELLSVDDRPLAIAHGGRLVHVPKPQIRFHEWNEAVVFIGHGLAALIRKPDSAIFGDSRIPEINRSAFPPRQLAYPPGNLTKHLGSDRGIRQQAADVACRLSQGRHDGRRVAVLFQPALDLLFQAGLVYIGATASRREIDRVEPWKGSVRRHSHFPGWGLATSRRANLPASAGGSTKSESWKGQSLSADLVPRRCHGLDTRTDASDISIPPAARRGGQT